MEELTNLHLGGIIVPDYSLEETKLSKYAPSLVYNLWDDMSRFVTGVSNDLIEEFHRECVLV